jgi:4-hydroxy-tetrahydrodipicolinate synthase
MKNELKHHGVVVPMITPVTESGDLDESAVGRLVDTLLDGGVEGIFALGTTGEGVNVPAAARRRLVQCVTSRVRGRAMIYAGLGDIKPAEFHAVNEFFRAGANAVVAHPPISVAVPVNELTAWYLALLKELDGPLIIYNIPSTTGVSIPLETIEKLANHPKVAGLKDSENNPQRHAELLKRFGKRPDFAIFVGVGALMAQGLKLGAKGIVPSVGNLIPEVCRDLCASAKRGDWADADTHFTRMNAVAALYQKGRTLGQSLAALKTALYHRGLCTPNVLPPLLPLTKSESELLRGEMSQLHLLTERR